MNPTHLILFDIDGTLLSAKQEAWKLAANESVEKCWMGEVEMMRDVIHDVTGIKVDPYRYKASGKTDAQVVFELFEGICMAEEEIYDWLPKLYDEYLKRLGKVINGPQSVELMPGARELLEELSARKDVVLSLLTGNCLGAARLKLATHGLEKYFVFEAGAYGDRAKHRDELPTEAVKAAKKHKGHHFAGTQVVLVGDTPSDVRCVKTIQARVLAVATGSYSLEQLQAEGPDHLFSNLSDKSKILSALFKS
jgi:phosphoglycolate phosphatase